MEWGTVGNLAQGAGALVQGIAGLFGPGPSDLAAKKSIRWRVRDAKKAGIHPLYALGAPAFGPTQEVGGRAESLGAGLQGMGQAMRQQGQDLDRAAMAAQLNEDRAAGKIADALQLEHLGLQNDLLRSQIARANSAQVGPGAASMFPSAGGVKTSPVELGAAFPGDPAVEAGATTDRGYAFTGTGWAPQPSYDVKQRIEDMFIPEQAWGLRNNILPMFGFHFNPPPGVKLPEGEEWTYNPFTNQYEGRPWWTTVPGLEKALSEWWARRRPLGTSPARFGDLFGGK